MNDVFLSSCDHCHHYTLSRIWGEGEGAVGRGGEGGIISAELILSIHTEWLCPQRRLEGLSRLHFSPPKWKLVFWESYY